MGIVAVFFECFDQQSEHPALPRMVDVAPELYTVKGVKQPTVIIEAALGASSAEWRQVQDKLAVKSKVLSYDRAGYGWSPLLPGARSADELVKELRFLIKKENLTPPYILVGHDVGALYMVRFAQAYPSEVIALVLVDPFPVNIADFKSRLETAVYKNFIDRRASYKTGAFFAKAGIVRALKIVPYKQVPAELRRDIQENFCLPGMYTAALREYKEALRVTHGSLRKGGRLHGIPISLLTHSRTVYRKEMKFFGVPVDEAEKVEKLWGESYALLMGLSNRSRIIEAAECKQYAPYRI